MKVIRTTMYNAACLVGLALILTPSPAAADHVILDDCIITGSTCIGFDCVNGESFGFDTLRLKENNLRIHFDDTSSAASFPTANWRIVINDSTNGGGSFFAVEDDSGDRSFKVENGARANALFVEDDGDIGIGTSTPVADVHIKTGNTPTLRLEQDGSSGFAAQTWDLAGNEANFFVRDASSGSTLPLRIFPGAPSNAISVEGSTGDVGLGITSPEAAIHVSRSAQAGMRFRSTGAASVPDGWSFLTNAGGNFIINSVGVGPGNEMVIHPTTGDVTILGDYFSATCGSPGSPCAPDYVFESDYPLMPIGDLAEYVEREKHLPNIPSAKELVGPINISKMQMRLLEKVEELVLYTIEQQSTIENLQQRLANLEGQPE